MKRLVLLILPCMVVASCSKRTTVSDTVVESSSIQMKVENFESDIMPKASVFKMSGDFQDNVGVTLNADGTLAYYPAITDITAQSAPQALQGGWWLNRQGLSGGSVFTKWTFDEYRNLPVQPTREEIIEAIIPGATVTQMVTLPVSLADALADPKVCLEYISK